MLSTNIDLRTAFLGLVNIVQRFGDDHQAKNASGGIGCTYLTETNGYPNTTGPLVPVCIVGQYLSDLGILRAVLIDMGETYGACSTGSGVWDNAETMGVTFDEDAKDFLRLVQSKQDGGTAWGDALRQSLAETIQNAQDAAAAPFYGWAGEAAAPVVEEPLAPWEVELLSGDPWQQEPADFQF